MSAGPAPPNPGHPKKPIGAKSAGAGFGRRVALGGLAAALVYSLLPARSPKPAGSPVDTFKTPGVRNIENAYSNGGATPTHTKGYGGSIQGQKSGGTLRENHGTNRPNGFNDPDIGADQRPDRPTKIEEAFNQVNYGSSKGK